MAEPTNNSAHYQQQQTYDPSSLTQQYYVQTTSYSYPYSNPQYANIQPYPYPNLTVQPSQQEAQEPNPPGVTAPTPAPPPAQNYYYQYPAHDATVPAVLTGGSQQGGVDPGAAVVHQPIVQPLYGAIGLVNSVAPQGGGVQGPVGPRPKALSRPFRGRGRGRGRGQHKHAAAPAQDQAIFVQSGPHNQGGPPQPMPESYASTFGTIPMPVPTPMQFQGPAPSVPGLPTSRIARCELCKVDCNSLEILEQHKNGKKHKKKLKVFEDLQKFNQRAIGQPTELTSTSEVIPEVPSQPDKTEGSANEQVLPETLPSEATNEESKVALQNPKVEEVEPTEESEKKETVEHSEGPARGFKRKMRGGKVGRRIKPYGRPQRLVEPPKPKEVIPLVCELCNVKCESTVVFQSHLVGKKHLAKAKRFMSQQEALGQAVLQALQQITANASTSIAPHLHHQGFGIPLSAPAPNAKPIDVQASTSEPNMDGDKVEAIPQPQSLPANSEAEIPLNAEGKSKEDVPAGAQPVASGATLDESSALEQSAHPAEETITGQVQSDGANKEA